MIFIPLKGTKNPKFLHLKIVKKKKKKTQSIILVAKCVLGGFTGVKNKKQFH